MFSNVEIVTVRSFFTVKLQQLDLDKNLLTTLRLSCHLVFFIEFHRNLSFFSSHHVSERYKLHTQIGTQFFIYFVQFTCTIAHMYLLKAFRIITFKKYQMHMPCNIECYLLGSYYDKKCISHVSDDTSSVTFAYFWLYIVHCTWTIYRRVIGFRGALSENISGSPSQLILATIKGSVHSFTQAL